MNWVLLSLALVFAQLSVLAFGGGNAILPEMRHQVVEVYHWLSASEFNALFAMSQAAPGPNMMIVPLIGWHVAGWSGLLVAAVAKFGPSSVLTVLALHYWQKFKAHPWREYFEQALKPITVGLVLVSAVLIAEQASQNLLLIGIMLLCALLNYLKNIHPFWLMLLGGLLAVKFLA
jgi:chromate transporter